MPDIPIPVPDTRLLIPDTRYTYTSPITSPYNTTILLPDIPIPATYITRHQIYLYQTPAYLIPPRPADTLITPPKTTHGQTTIIGDYTKTTHSQTAKE